MNELEQVAERNVGIIYMETPSHSGHRGKRLSPSERPNNEYVGTMAGDTAGRVLAF